MKLISPLFVAAAIILTTQPSFAAPVSKKPHHPKEDLFDGGQHFPKGKKHVPVNVYYDNILQTTQMAGQKCTTWTPYKRDPAVDVWVPRCDRWEDDPNQKENYMLRQMTLTGWHVRCIEMVVKVEGGMVSPFCNYMIDTVYAKVIPHWHTVEAPAPPKGEDQAEVVKRKTECNGSYLCQTEVMEWAPGVISSVMGWPFGSDQPATVNPK